VRDLGIRDILHTSGGNTRSRWYEVVKEEDNEEEQAPGLQISGSLTLRHPSGFDFLHCACGAIASASSIISSWFFVGIVMIVPRWERD